MSSHKTWQQKANAILDRYTLHRGAPSFTRTSLAKELGISRQTLWRDEAIKNKILMILDKPKSKKRSTKDVRIQDLERRIRVLTHENGLLLQSILLICKRLREEDLDPEYYVSEAAAEIEEAFPDWPASKIFGSS